MITSLISLNFMRFSTTQNESDTDIHMLKKHNFVSKELQ